MLLSGIGKPYDPVAQTGVIGKNYCYQTGAARPLFRGQVFQSVHVRPAASTGARTISTSNWDFDRGQYGYVGGSTLAADRPTAADRLTGRCPRGTPPWGKAWKAATAKWYRRAMNISASGSVMANRYNCYDLDPTYRNAFGQPLMRMTFDYKENEHKWVAHIGAGDQRIAKSMNPTR